MSNQRVTVGKEHFYQEETLSHNEQLFGRGEMVTTPLATAIVLILLVVLGYCLIKILEEAGRLPDLEYYFRAILLVFVTSFAFSAIVTALGLTFDQNSTWQTAWQIGLDVSEVIDIVTGAITAWNVWQKIECRFF